jgi:putative ABC transport system ATP-binding protein
VVRALAKRPVLLLADEPTGSLDAQSESLVMKLLRRAAGEGTAIVLVTHTDRVAAAADRRFCLESGVLTEETGS